MDRREPLHITLMRTGMIALVIGAGLAGWSGRLGRWPVAALVALWPALGGDFVEVWFLNWVRPRLSGARGVQAGARIVVWFVGGIVLAVAMGLTARALEFQPARSAWGPGGWRWWWLWGLGFIGIELVAHLVLQLSGRASFYNGRG